MSRSRVVTAICGVAVVLLVLVVSYVATLVLFLDTCDADGGSPDTAQGSTAGQFCESPVSGWFFIAQLTVPALCAVAFSVLAVLRRRLAFVAIGLGTGLGVAAVMFAVVAFLPGTCSEEQQRSDPVGCRTY